jgi:hypothetical protein
MAFTKEMKSHLENSGWFSGRVNNEYNDFMDKYDYPDFIKEFIKEYGGLKVEELLSIEKDSNVVNRISLNPLDSDGMGSDSVSQDWANDLGRKLYVIGLYSPENYDIAVDEMGAVYFLGEYCWCLGKDLFEGLESIIRIDQWSSLELDPEDTSKGIWKNIKGEIVNFDDYKFDYKFF